MNPADQLPWKQSAVAFKPLTNKEGGDLQQQEHDDEEEDHQQDIHSQEMDEGGDDEEEEEEGQFVEGHSDLGRVFLQDVENPQAIERQQFYSFQENSEDNLEAVHSPSSQAQQSQQHLSQTTIQQSQSQQQQQQQQLQQYQQYQQQQQIQLQLQQQQQYQQHQLLNLPQKQQKQQQQQEQMISDQGRKHQYGMIPQQVQKQQDFNADHGNEEFEEQNQHDFDEQGQQDMEGQENEHEGVEGNDGDYNDNQQLNYDQVMDLLRQHGHENIDPAVLEQLLQNISAQQEDFQRSSYGSYEQHNQNEIQHQHILNSNTLEVPIQGYENSNKNIPNKSTEINPVVDENTHDNDKEEVIIMCMCAKCGQVPVNFIELNCKHSFCLECMAQWFLQEGYLSESQILSLQDDQQMNQQEDISLDVQCLLCEESTLLDSDSINAVKHVITQMSMLYFQQQQQLEEEQQNKGEEYLRRNQNNNLQEGDDDGDDNNNNNIDDVDGHEEGYQEQHNEDVSQGLLQREGGLIAEETEEETEEEDDEDGQKQKHNRRINPQQQQQQQQIKPIIGQQNQQAYPIMSSPDQANRQSIGGRDKQNNNDEDEELHEGYDNQQVNQQQIQQGIYEDYLEHVAEHGSPEEDEEDDKEEVYEGQIVQQQQKQQQGQEEYSDNDDEEVQVNDVNEDDQVDYLGVEQEQQDVDSNKRIDMINDQYDVFQESHQQQLTESQQQQQSHHGLQQSSGGQSIEFVSMRVSLSPNSNKNQQSALVQAFTSSVGSQQPQLGLSMSSQQQQQQSQQLQQQLQQSSQFDSQMSEVNNNNLNSISQASAKKNIIASNSSINPTKNNNTKQDIKSQNDYDRQLAQSQQQSQQFQQHKELSYEDFGNVSESSEAASAISLDQWKGKDMLRQIGKIDESNDQKKTRNGSNSNKIAELTMNKQNSYPSNKDTNNNASNKVYNMNSSGAFNQGTENLQNNNTNNINSKINTENSNSGRNVNADKYLPNNQQQQQYINNNEQQQQFNGSTAVPAAGACFSPEIPKEKKPIGIASSSEFTHSFGQSLQSLKQQQQQQQQAAEQQQIRNSSKGSSGSNWRRTIGDGAKDMTEEEKLNQGTQQFSSYSNQESKVSQQQQQLQSYPTWNQQQPGQQQSQQQQYYYYQGEIPDSDNFENEEQEEDSRHEMQHQSQQQQQQSQQQQQQSQQQYIDNIKRSKIPSNPYEYEDYEQSLSTDRQQQEQHSVSSSRDHNPQDNYYQSNQSESNSKQQQQQQQQYYHSQSYQQSRSYQQLYPKEHDSSQQQQQQYPRKSESQPQSSRDRHEQLEDACPDHPSEELCFFSFSRNKSLCLRCLQSGQLLNEEVVSYESGLSQITEHVEESKRQLQLCQELFKVNIKKHEEAAQRNNQRARDSSALIAQQMSALIQRLQEKQAELIQEANRVIEINDAECNTKIEVTQQKMDVLRQLSNGFNNVQDQLNVHGYSSVDNNGSSSSRKKNINARIFNDYSKCQQYFEGFLAENQEQLVRQNQESDYRDNNIDQQSPDQKDIKQLGQSQGQRKQAHNMEQTNSIEELIKLVDQIQLISQHDKEDRQLENEQQQQLQGSLRISEQSLGNVQHDSSLGNNNNNNNNNSGNIRSSEVHQEQIQMNDRIMQTPYGNNNSNNSSNTIGNNSNPPHGSSKQFQQFQLSSKTDHNNSSVPIKSQQQYGQTNDYHSNTQPVTKSASYLFQNNPQTLQHPLSSTGSPIISSYLQQPSTTNQGYLQRSNIQQLNQPAPIWQGYIGQEDQNKQIFDYPYNQPTREIIPEAALRGVNKQQPIGNNNNNINLIEDNKNSNKLPVFYKSGDNKLGNNYPNTFNEFLMPQKKQQTQSEYVLKNTQQQNNKQQQLFTLQQQQLDQKKYPGTSNQLQQQQQNQSASEMIAMMMLKSNSHSNLTALSEESKIHRKTDPGNNHQSSRISNEKYPGFDQQQSELNKNLLMIDKSFNSFKSTLQEGFIDIPREIPTINTGSIADLFKKAGSIPSILPEKDRLSPSRFLKPNHQLHGFSSSNTKTGKISSMNNHQSTSSQSDIAQRVAAACSALRINSPFISTKINNNSNNDSQKQLQSQQQQQQSFVPRRGGQVSSRIDGSTSSSGSILNEIYQTTSNSSLLGANNNSNANRDIDMKSRFQSVKEQQQQLEKQYELKIAFKHKISKENTTLRREKSPVNSGSSRSSHLLLNSSATNGSFSSELKSSFTDTHASTARFLTASRKSERSPQQFIQFNSNSPNSTAALPTATTAGNGLPKFVKSQKQSSSGNLHAFFNQNSSHSGNNTNTANYSNTINNSGFGLTGNLTNNSLSNAGGNNNLQNEKNQNLSFHGTKNYGGGQKFQTADNKQQGFAYKSLKKYEDLFKRQKQIMLNKEHF